MSDSALRALLALIRLSFFYEPEKSAWVKPGRSFSRSDIQAECALSGQGTRNGLSELEEMGYVSVDRSGKGYEYALEMEVPSSEFTYVPTALFEEAQGLSGTELRLALAVLRATWGWTTDSTESDGGAPRHQRWAQLSVATLSQLTGRSASAVKTAARDLQGTFLQRRRPTTGAYYYRFRSEMLTGEIPPKEAQTEEKSLQVKTRARGFLSMAIPNDLPPDRQRSGPPRRENIESFTERPTQHSGRNKWAGQAPEKPPFPSENPAVRGQKTPSRGSEKQSAQNQSRKARSKQVPRRWPAAGPAASNESLNLTGFSGRKRELGQKMANAGVWPHRIPELLGRYSVGRIEANFQLYRKRGRAVENDGAFLAAAIEGGFALPSHSDGETENSADQESSGFASEHDGLPEPGTKVSETCRRELIEAGQATKADFEKFADYDDPTRKQHFFRLEKTRSPAARA